MIAIVDYGAGNIRSVINAFNYLGEDVRVCDKPEMIRPADKVVFPGVGSSRDALEGLRSAGLVEPLVEHMDRGTPFLGICLGLQLLFSFSEEDGGCDCLDRVNGKVRRFPGGEGMKVPQIGWNTVKITREDCPLFRGVGNNSYFYFVHSYYCDNDEPYLTCGETEYGVTYTSALWKDNVFAVQFHPERSQAKGLKILENFAKL